MLTGKGSKPVDLDICFLCQEIRSANSPTVSANILSYTPPGSTKQDRKRYRNEYSSTYQGGDFPSREEDIQPLLDDRRVIGKDMENRLVNLSCWEKVLVL